MLAIPLQFLLMCCLCSYGYEHKLLRGGKGVRGKGDRDGRGGIRKKGEEGGKE